MKNSRKPKSKKIYRMFAGVFVLVIAVLVGAYFYVGAFSRGRLYDDAASVPYRRAALVLGCSRYAYGRLNLYYQYRINAAVELWQTGKIDAVLVSGDNSSTDYNEPGDMKADLIDKGVPAEYITIDAAGLRTLDSVVRAKNIFGLKDYIIISQKFHCQRAIYLASRNNQSVIGFCAAEPRGTLTVKVRLREVLARLKAVIDVIFAKQPKYLGRQETVRYRDPNE